MSVKEKTGQILPLTANKNVRIIPRGNGIIVYCERTQLTPGAYSTVSVVPNTWYEIDIRCTRFGGGLPGLWVADSSKNTLFYGNFFKYNSASYLKRKFFSGQYTSLLIGILVKNATRGSGYYIDQFSFTQVDENEKRNSNTESKKSHETTSSESSGRIGSVNSMENSSADLANSRQIERDAMETESKVSDMLRDLQRTTAELQANQEVQEPDTPEESIERAPRKDDPVETQFQRDMELEQYSSILKSTELTTKQLEESYDSEESDESDDSDDSDDSEDEPESPPAITNEDMEEVKFVRKTLEKKNDPPPVNHTKSNKFIYRIHENNADFNMTIEVSSYRSYRGAQVYPISFGIPESFVLDYVPEKKRDFFPQKVGEDPMESYKNDTDRYWSDLRESRFLLVNRQGVGWDTPIIVEALSQGCIPLFIEDVPENSLCFIPKRFLEGVRNAKGVHIGWVDRNIFSQEGYVKVANYLLNFTKNHLTTKAMARYIIATTGKDIKTVLFLGYAQDIDEYLFQQSVLHGMKDHLGDENVVDVPKMDSLYKKSIRAKMYREGVPYMASLKEKSVNRGTIERRIMNREFDIVIVMGSFTKKDQERLHLSTGCFPYGAQVESAYDKSEILFIDGHENPEESRNGLFQFSHRGTFFMREHGV